MSVKKVLETDRDGAGSPIRYPAGHPLLTGVVVDIPPGKDTGWHTHPSPCVAYVLEGEILIKFADGSSRKLKAGEAAAEVVNVLHCGYNLTSKPVRIIMFAVGEKGVPISRRATHSPAG